MTRTVSAWVSAGDELLGGVGPFPVDIPWWSEAAPVVDRLEKLLGVPVLVLRLLDVDGGEGGRDGHVTYHVEALGRPAPGTLSRQRTVEPHLFGADEVFRSPWARADGLRELFGWAEETLAAAGRPVTGPVEQRRTWNLAGLFRLPTARGPVWLKATPRFAADEAAAISAFARVDTGLVPVLVGSAERRVLMEHIPGVDCWQPSAETIGAAMERMVAAQVALAELGPECLGGGSSPSAHVGGPDQPASGDGPPSAGSVDERPSPSGVPDRRVPDLVTAVHALLDGPAARELTAQDRFAARELTRRWETLTECGLPDTLVHGDFHPGNWRSDGGPPVVVDFADAHWGHPVLDGLRVHHFLAEPGRATAARAWSDAWKTRVPASDPARALVLAEPLAQLTYAVRYQEFLDGIEPSERVYHEGDPVDAIRAALRSAREPSPHLASAGTPTEAR
ncbi:aminoglycoside phosphotransferase family protein [Streptomyces fagopyri]|uniref:aminoglycoside phosphotransferase family protein n=1 Tax=Streptomyces fagopyri TaxID=2662397 RepID=UPI001D17169B|nr:aminoglycoside phosphotransferase family protein [Streptomyces fagopyri]